MLTLSREPGEKIYVGRGIVLVVHGVRHGRIAISVEAPGHAITRAELGLEYHQLAQLALEQGLPAPRRPRHADRP